MKPKIVRLKNTEGYYGFYDENGKLAYQFSWDSEHLNVVHHILEIVGVEHDIQNIDSPELPDSIK